jgi:hypothetical protein
MLRETTLAGVVLGLLSAPVIAHHSQAMFDQDTTLERQAAVVEFQWTNPHSWLEVMITDDQGQSTQWSIEMSSPGSLSNDGWRPRTLVPGDEVTVRFHPRKDGTTSGQFVSLVAPDGEQFGD